MKLNNAARRRGPAVPRPPLESPLDVETRGYAPSDLKRLVNLPTTLIRLLERAGHLHPVRTKGKVTYSFQDLVVMRAASGLRAAKISEAKIPDALTKLREALPEGSGLTALPVTAVEHDAINHEGNKMEGPSLEQFTLPFVVDHRNVKVTTLKRRQAVEQRRQAAEKHFADALAVEETDITAARAGYLAALDAHSGHVEARINLGRLLHLNGELLAAEKVYRDAKHASALLAFNLATLLEDLNREEEAILSYREALALDPSMHDAHYNLSRLHEDAKRPREALQHLLAYRRSSRAFSDK